MHARYNYNGASTQSQANILSDIAGLLSGITTASQLTGKVLLSSAAAGITNASLTVTWAGAHDGTGLAGAKNCEVGQSVLHPNIPSGATIATITNGTGFTLNTSHEATATDAAAILTLDATSTLPPSTIGNTSPTINWNSGTSTTTINWTGACTATLGILAVGMSVEGAGISAGATIATIPNANSFTITGGTVSGTVTNGSIVLKPAAALCDTTNTTISAAIGVAGWKLWDMFGNAGLPNWWVFRTPYPDTAAKYGYILLDVSTAGSFALQLWEDWVPSSHAGSNQARPTSVPLAAGAQQRITPTVAASLIVNAETSKRLVMQSTTAAGVGAASYNDWTGVFFRTRLSPWDTVANGYPTTILTNGNSLCGTGSGSTAMACCPRFKNPLGGDFTTTAAHVSPAALGGGGAASTYNALPALTAANVPTSKIPDGLGGFYTPLTDVHFRSGLGTNAFLGGSISQAADVWLGIPYPNNLDTMTANGKEYIFLQNQTAPASYGHLVVPKG